MSILIETSYTLKSNAAAYLPKCIILLHAKSK